MCARSQAEIESPLGGAAIMTFFRSYFDESGKFKDHRVISFCGVVASHESLDCFNKAWDGLLRKNQLESFHTKHALQCGRNFSHVIRKESAIDRCNSLKPFVDCIVDNLELGIVVALDVAAYSKWSPGAKKRVWGNDDPAYLAFTQASAALKKHACRDEDRISIMCDDREETALNFYQIYRRFKRTSPELRKKFVSLSFADDKSFPALQAADLIAALVRLESLKRFNYHTHDYGPLVSDLICQRPHQKLHWIGIIGDKLKLEEIGGRLEAARS